MFGVKQHNAESYNIYPEQAYIENLDLNSRVDADTRTAYDQLHNFGSVPKQVYYQPIQQSGIRDTQLLRLLSKYIGEQVPQLEFKLPEVWDQQHTHTNKK